MPFTPFHFGAHACVALPIDKHINTIVFILANVVIDIEPLLVMVFNLSYPLHGCAHTFIGASIVGGIWGFIAYQFRTTFEAVLETLKLPHKFALKQYILSGILGALLHVLFDAPLYADIRPFYPLETNPLYGLISSPLMYGICSILFVLAVILYFCAIRRHERTKSS